MNKELKQVRDNVVAVLDYLSPFIKLGGWFTVIGVLVVVTYFQQIRYLPPLDLQNLSLLFIVATILSLQILLILGAFNVSIAIIWSLADKVPEIRQVLSNQNETESSPEKIWSASFKRTCGYFILPTALFTGSIFLAFYENYIAAALILLLFIPFFSLYLRRIKNLDLKYVLVILFSSLLSSLFLVLAVMLWVLIAADSSAETKAFQEYSMIAGMTFSLLVLAALARNPYPNFFVDSPEETRRSLWMGMIGLSAAIILLFILGAKKFPEMIVRNYGVGGVENAEVVLNAEGLAAMQLAGLPCAGDSTKKYCKIAPVSILWMRGNEYAFEASAKKEDPKQDNKEKNPINATGNIKVIVPSRVVVSIATKPRRK